MGNAEKEIIELYGVGDSAWGIPFFNVSPFACKLEAWLCITGLPYKTVQVNSMGKAPKGKIPWMVLGDVVMGDSELIIKYLSQRFNVDPDGELSALERAHTKAYCAMLEEHYHQIWEGFTFVDDTSEEISREVFKSAPAPIRSLVRGKLRRHLKKHLHERGISRHSHDEIMAMGIQDLEALSAFLGDRDFFFGDKPHYLDCSAFGFVELTLAQPPLTAVHKRAHELENLVAFCDRMRTLCFGQAGQEKPDARAA
jgi:glutathione S-transferase